MLQAQREHLLWLTATLLLALAVGLPTLHQPESYHAFADARSGLGVPRAADTLSNLPFALVGLWGLCQLQRRAALPQADRYLLMLFFVGLLATAAGSSWYHLAPTDARLVWDRAGMTPSFAGVVALAVAQRISSRAGIALATASLLLGWLSIAVWSHTANLMP